VPAKEQLIIEAKFVIGKFKGDAAKAERSVKSLGRTADRQFSTIQASAQSAGAAVGFLQKRFVALGAAIGLTLFLKRSATAALEFRAAMAEVSTIIDLNVDSVQELSDGVRELARAQGTNEQIVAKGLYQAISSGIGDGAESLKFLQQANKLAVGGVASTSEAVDLLTSALNAYGLQIEETSAISDTFFVGVQRGKTKIEELAATLGQVLPLAATLGATIEEVTAAVAALTLGGLSTSEAVTQLRSALTAFVKKAETANNVLGENQQVLNGSAIRTKGLVVALQDLRDATGGSEEILIKLIGRIEGTAGVLALTGNQADSFQRILLEMGTSAGVANRAFKLIDEDSGRRLTKRFNQLKITGSEFLEFLLIDVEDKAQSITRVFNNIFGSTSGFDETRRQLEALLEPLGLSGDQRAAFEGVFSTGLGIADQIIPKDAPDVVGQRYEDLRTAIALGAQGAQLELLKSEAALQAVKIGFGTVDGRARIDLLLSQDQDIPGLDEALRRLEGAAGGGRALEIKREFDELVKDLTGTAQKESRKLIESQLTDLGRLSSEFRRLLAEGQVDAARQIATQASQFSRGLDDLFGRREALRVEVPIEVELTDFDEQRRFLEQAVFNRAITVEGVAVQLTTKAPPDSQVREKMEALQTTAEKAALSLQGIVVPFTIESDDTIDEVIQQFRTLGDVRDDAALRVAAEEIFPDFGGLEQIVTDAEGNFVRIVRGAEEAADGVRSAFTFEPVNPLLELELEPDVEKRQALKRRLDRIQELRAQREELARERVGVETPAEQISAVIAFSRQVESEMERIRIKSLEDVVSVGNASAAEFRELRRLSKKAVDDTVGNALAKLGELAAANPDASAFFPDLEADIRDLGVATSAAERLEALERGRSGRQSARSRASSEAEARLQSGRDVEVTIAEGRISQLREEASLLSDLADATGEAADAEAARQAATSASLADSRFRVEQAVASEVERFRAGERTLAQLFKVTNEIVRSGDAARLTAEQADKIAASLERAAQARDAEGRHGERENLRIQALTGVQAEIEAIRERGRAFAASAEIEAQSNVAAREGLDQLLTLNERVTNAQLTRLGISIANTGAVEKANQDLFDSIERQLSGEVASGAIRSMDTLIARAKQLATEGRAGFDSFADGARAALTDFQTSVADDFASGAALMEAGLDGIGQATGAAFDILTDSSEDASDRFREAISNIIADIGRLIAQQAVLKGVGSLLPSPDAASPTFGETGGQIGPPEATQAIQAQAALSEGGAAAGAGIVAGATEGAGTLTGAGTATGASIAAGGGKAGSSVTTASTAGGAAIGAGGETAASAIAGAAGLLNQAALAISLAAKELEAAALIAASIQSVSTPAGGGAPATPLALGGVFRGQAERPRNAQTGFVARKETLLRVAEIPGLEEAVIPLAHGSVPISVPDGAGKTPVVLDHAGLAAMLAPLILGERGDRPLPERVLGSLPPLRIESPEDISVRVEAPGALSVDAPDELPPLRLEEPAPLRVEAPELRIEAPPPFVLSVPPLEVEVPTIPALRAPPIPPLRIEPTEPLVIQAIDPLPVLAPEAIRVDVGLPVLPTLGVEAPPPIQVDVGPVPSIQVDVPRLEAPRIDPLRLEVPTIEPLRVAEPEPVRVDVPDVDVGPIPAVRFEAPPLIGFGPAPRVTLDAPDTLPRFEAPEIDPIEFQPIEPVRIVVPSFEPLQVEPIEPIGVRVPRFDPLRVERVGPIRVIPPRIDPLEIGKIEPVRVIVPDFAALRVEPVEPINVIVPPFAPLRVERLAPLEVESVGPLRLEAPQLPVLPELRVQLPGPLPVAASPLTVEPLEPLSVENRVLGVEAVPPLAVERPDPISLLLPDLPAERERAAQRALPSPEQVRPDLLQREDRFSPALIAREIAQALPRPEQRSAGESQRQAQPKIEVHINPQMHLTVQSLDSGSGAEELVARQWPTLRNQLISDIVSGSERGLREALRTANR